MDFEFKVRASMVGLACAVTITNGNHLHKSNKHLYISVCHFKRALSAAKNWWGEWFG